MAMNRAGSCNPAILKVAFVMLGLCLAGYLLGPPLYFHLMEGLAAVRRSSSSVSCPPCNCDCSSQPLLSIPQGLINGSFADCAKHDPEVSEDTEKNFAELLSEELKLREAEALESQQKADMALLEAKKDNIPVPKGSGQVQLRNGDMRRGKRESRSGSNGTEKTNGNVGT